MKIKNLFVAIVALMAVMFGFTACLGDGNGGKYNYGYASPAIIESSLGSGYFLKTYYGTFVPDNASALNLMTLPVGSCIYMTFEYNSDYQTGEYYVASNIKHVPVSIDYIRDEHAELINDYNYPFSSVELFNESFSLNYKGKFFIATKAKLAQNQALDYYLYTKSDEQPDANGTRNIYLQAQLPGTQSGTQDITEVRALDISRMFYSSGRDTTIYDGSISYSLKYLKINLQYCSKIENEAPVFNSVNEQPLVIYALRDDL